MNTSKLGSNAREVILAASKELFARQGLAATPIKAIADLAGVNSALIYYYFADKGALYEAVLLDLTSQLPDPLQTLAEQAVTPSKALALVVRGQASCFLSEPALARLLARELADHEAAHATDVLRPWVRRSLGLIARLIREGQASGCFNPAFAPELAALSVMSQVNWFCIAGPAIEQLLAQPGVARDPAAVRQFSEHAAQFSLAGLAPVLAAPRRDS